MYIISQKFHERGVSWVHLNSKLCTIILSTLLVCINKYSDLITETYYVYWFWVEYFRIKINIRSHWCKDRTHKKIAVKTQMQKKIEIKTLWGKNILHMFVHICIKTRNKHLHNNLGSINGVRRGRGYPFSWPMTGEGSVLKTKWSTKTPQPWCLK